jgi:hypothetical protein
MQELKKNYFYTCYLKTIIKIKNNRQKKTVNILHLMNNGIILRYLEIK